MDKLNPHSKSLKEKGATSQSKASELKDLPSGIASFLAMTNIDVRVP